MRTTNVLRSLGWAVSTAVLVSACGGGNGSEQVATSAQAASEPVERIEPYTSSAPEAPSPFKSRVVAKSAKVDVEAIDLGPLTLAKSAAETASAILPGVPRQIGVGRKVAQTSSAAETAGRLKWATHANGSRVASISFTSPQAVGLRLGIKIGALPGDAIVRVYAQNGSTLFEVSGQEILGVIGTNLAAGDQSDAARTYWTPVVDGDEATLEIEIPPGIPQTVDIAVPQISHLYETSNAIVPKIGESASCQQDVSCRLEGADNYAEESKSVARMTFTEDGVSYRCSGTLLADSAASGTPYFLSANHCIASQTVASTLTTDWFYRSSSCNASTVNSGTRQVTGGATLLYANGDTDTSFMRLNNAPPAGVVFAGSSTAATSVGTSVVGLHHPRSDLQKISDGKVTSYSNCVFVGGELGCYSGQSSGNYLTLKWSKGLTQTGSSGSSAFSTINGKRYVVGQLLGGTANNSCTNTGEDFYGRFDVAYNAKLKTWLAASGTAPRSPVYRFYNSTTRAHFYTMDAAERDLVIAKMPQYRYENIAFYAYGSKVGDTIAAVYRFYNTFSNSHFYTISTVERDLVLNNQRFLYEGERWYASTAAITGTVPMHRFYNASAGTHFYTISEGEKEFVRINDRSYQYEGVVYYAWPAQQ